jgi:hypothetical protein
VLETQQCPIVTDAHPFAEVWMENRGNHCAFRLQPWVICMQVDFYDMCVSTLYSVSCCIPEQPGNMVGYCISFRGISLDRTNLYIRIA